MAVAERKERTCSLPGGLLVCASILSERQTERGETEIVRKKKGGRKGESKGGREGGREDGREAGWGGGKYKTEGVERDKEGGKKFI